MSEYKMIGRLQMLNNNKKRQKFAIEDEKQYIYLVSFVHLEQELTNGDFYLPVYFYIIFISSLVWRDWA